MTTVTGTITTAAGTHPRGASVTVTLVDQAGRATAGFAGATEILGVVSVPVAADGSWSVSLTPSADITSPRGATLYQVSERVQQGVSASYYISVPTSPTAVWVGDLRVSLPGSAPEQLAGYLPLTGGTVSGPIVLPDASPAASEAYVASHGGGGGGGTPAGTVVAETSYGQAAAAGAATAYAREDHTHGTPPLPTPAAIGGATADHTHAGTYDPAGTASAAVSAHTGAADPHPGYLTPAEADAIYAPLRGTGIYPPAGYGLLAMSGTPESFMLGSSPSNNTATGACVWIPAGVAITNLWAAVRAGGTYSASGTPNRLGLYDDNGAQVALTPDDSTLWTAAGWRGGALTGGPIAAQGAGRWVYVLAIVGGMSGVTVPYPSAANDANSPWFDVGVSVARRRAFYTGGVVAMPASFDPTGYGTPTTYVPLLGVS
ncbi:hypothetical protein [Streptosporangium sp. NPDC004631]